jgi:hypothetical protein
LRISWFATAFVALVASYFLLVPRAAAESREVESGGHRYTIGPPDGFVESLAIDAEWPASAAAFDDGRWRVWLMDSQVDRRADEAVRYTDYVYQPMQPSLVGEAAKFQIDFNPEFERLVLHAIEVRRGGRWSTRLDPARVTLARREQEFEQDMANGTVSALVVLDDVRTEDVIRLRWSIVGGNPILDGQRLDVASFGWDHPMLRRRFRLLVPPGTALEELAGVGVPRGRTRRSADAFERVFEANRLPAVRDEGSYPLWVDPTPTLYIGLRQTWADVARWATQLYPTSAPLPPSLEARIAEWTRIPGGEARLAAALRSVQDEVRYFGIEIGDSTHRPAEPATTWERRYGDCKDKARLLVTILGRLGIEAVPALVSASRGKGVRALPPSGSAFDHVIVRARLEGDEVWVDPTRSQQRGSPRAMPLGSFGFALPVSPGVDALVAVPQAGINRTVVHEEFALQASGEVQLDVRTEYHGFAAERQRVSRQNEGEEQISRWYLDHYRRRFGDVALRAPLEHEDREEHNVVVVRESYVLASPWMQTTPSSRILELVPDALSGVADLPSVLDRTSPLPLVHPLEIEQETRITLPDGWRWTNPPQPRRYEDSGFAYSSDYSAGSGSARLSQTFETRSDSVPTGMLEAHLKLRREINDDLGTRLMFEVPAAQAARSRRQRLNSLVRDLLDKPGGGK